jgi:hypothetical protein
MVKNNANFRALNKEKKTPIMKTKDQDLIQILEEAEKE